MELPSSVVVGHLVYSVEFMTVDDVSNYDADGYCNSKLAAIKINPNQHSWVVFETLIHELGHAVNAMAHVEDDTKEEDLVLRTTPIWLTVWRDNPELLAILCRYCQAKS